MTITYSTIRFCPEDMLRLTAPVQNVRDRNKEDLEAASAYDIRLLCRHCFINNVGQLLIESKDLSNELRYQESKGLVV